MKKLGKNIKILIYSILLVMFISTDKVLARTTYTFKINLEEDVNFTHKTIPDINGHGMQDINYIDFNYNNDNLLISLIKANNTSGSKETLLNQLNDFENRTSNDIIGGINGDFFNLVNGQPLFTTIANGEIYSVIENSSDSSKRPVFYIDKENNLGFDFFDIKGELKFTNGIYPNLDITSVNKIDSYNNTNVANYKINNNSTYYPHEGLHSRYMLIELLNSDGSIIAGEKIYGKIIEIGEMSEPKKIEKNQLLITSYGDKNYNNISYEFLNNTVVLEFNIFSQNEGRIKNNIETAFTGHEYLIKDGQKMNYNYYKTLGDDAFIKEHHSRSALGITEDNRLILFTVDENKTSRGMTLDELATALQDLGVVTAINLDGGGSTSITLENNESVLQLMNDKSKHQREITDSIGIIKK